MGAAWKCWGSLASTQLARGGFLRAISRLGSGVRASLLRRPPMNHLIARVCLLFSVALLCQCGLPDLPQCVRVPFASRGDHSQLIASAQADWAILASTSRRDEWPAAQARYNATTAKLFDQLRCGPDDWNKRAAALGTRIAAAGETTSDPEKLDHIIPAATVTNRGKIVQHHRTDGLGVPLVGWKETSPFGQERERFQLPNGMPYILTALLAFDPSGTPEWRFMKRWSVNETKVGASIHPLAADWTAPNALYWKMSELNKLLIQNVILPDRFTEETALYFITPYDPEKIPLVLIHGLASSPDAFGNVINELSPEPWFREKYQIWLFNYPTGNPWFYSSMKFRQVMNDVCNFARTQGHDRNLERMVVAGHSMGGLIARSSVTAPGSTFHDAVFLKPINDLVFSESERHLIQEGLNYQPLTEPARMVYMAVPHRGSPLANLRISILFSRMIQLPKTLTVELLDSSLLAMSDVMVGENPVKRMPTSINSLSPDNRMTIALNELPLPAHLPTHSIIGDRGRGDTPDSSDGIVPYWSSHVTPVASETIVPSGHEVPDHLDATAELKKILKLHLKE